MIWQELIFMGGAVVGIIALSPTLRNRAATVPFGTSVPSAVMGAIYGLTYYTMGMSGSALGALLTGVLWGLIALLRHPRGDIPQEGADISPAVKQ